MKKDSRVYPASTGGRPGSRLNQSTDPFTKGQMEKGISKAA